MQLSKFSLPTHEVIKECGFLICFMALSTCILTEAMF